MEGKVTGNNSHGRAHDLSTSTDATPPLPPALMRRVKALKKLQNEWAKMEVKFYDELHQVEMKYAGLVQPIYDKRRDIVRGMYEPTDAECEWVDEDEEIDETTGKVGQLGITSSKDSSLPAGSPESGDAMAEALKGIPAFWLHVFKNFDTISDMVQENDESILKHLEDVRCVYNQSPAGFTLEFHFSSNEYFTNTVLTKSYEYDEKIPENILDYEGSSIKQSKGCTINWNKGKNVTVKTVKKKQKHKQHGQTRVVTKQVKADSFFNFFDTITPPEDHGEEGEEEADEETLDLLEADYEIGMLIRDRVISRAVLIFTGEYLEDDDMDEDDDIYGEEGEEEEEEAEEEEESHHGGRFRGGHGHGHGLRHRGPSDSSGKGHRGADKV